MTAIQLRPGEGRPAKVFAELSIVSLVRPVRVEYAGLLPGGTQGTVVAAYADGQGYEVEFHQPFHAVVTVSGDDLA